MYIPDIVIYHADCLDGTTAASILNHFYSFETDHKIEYMPYQYSSKPPSEEFFKKIDKKKLLIVDFSFNIAVMQELEASAEFVVVLDHHKTAEKALEKYIIPHKLGVMTLDLESYTQGKKIVANFEKDECGASMAWNFVYPGADYPKYLEYVRDHDLHLRKFPNSIDFSYWARTIKKNVLDISYLINFSSESWRKANAWPVGTALREYTEEVARSQIKHGLQEVLYYMKNDEVFHMGIVHLPPFISSDVMNYILAEPDCKFDGIMSFTIYPDSVGVSIRSVRNQAARKIAESWGGGGHDNAAGCSIPWDKYVNIRGSFK